VPPLYIDFFFLKNTKISIFGGISKFHLWADFGRFWRILAALGNFGQIWADFPAFTVAKSMPELRLKSSKPYTFSTVSSNVTCNGLLESYHPYL
jgi:hypothetical protein